MSNFHEMFQDGIKDIYNAEKQLLKALPRFAKMAKEPELKQAFERHFMETEEQCRRIEQAAQILGFKPTGMVCKGMQGLVEEGNEHMKGLKPSATTDAELIALAQKNEHYEIATYGTLCEWAKCMGHNEVLTLLKQNMAEEEQTDKMLTQMAESRINMMAAEESNQMMMEEQQKPRRATASRSAGGSRGGAKSGGGSKSGGAQSGGSKSGGNNSGGNKSGGNRSTGGRAKAASAGGRKSSGGGRSSSPRGRVSVR